MKSLLLSILIILPSIALSTNCAQWLNQILEQRERYYKEFNLTSFLEQKELFKKKIRQGLKIETYTANTPEQFLALAEAHFDILDVAGRRFEDLIKNGPTKKQKKVMRILSKKMDNKPLQYKNINRMIKDIYGAIVIPDADFLHRHIPIFNINKILWERIHTTFARQGVENALRELGFMKTSALQRKLQQWGIYKYVDFGSKFRQWSLTKGIAKEAILTGFVNYMGINFFRIPTHAPMTHMLQQMNLSNDFLEILTRDGSNAAKKFVKEAYEKSLQKEYGNLRKMIYFESIYGPLAKAYNYGFITFYFYFMFDQSPTTEELTDFEPILLDENFFDPQEVRLNIFSKWRFDFHKENGRFPNQEEANEFYDKLNEMTDEELRAVYDLEREPASKKTLTAPL